jgi:di/tricarboxylate transporter
MNNVGVAALLLPVVVDIARSTNRSPSKLLIPLAYGSLLGGMTTLIGTPPNMIVSDGLADRGLPTFGFFDYTPVGLVALLAGVAFMALVGRHMLPKRDPVSESRPSRVVDLEDVYDLEERLFNIQLPPDSPLSGRTLTESRFGSALGLNVLAIVRQDRTILSPAPTTVLQGNDRLLVQGRKERLAQLNGGSQLLVDTDAQTCHPLVTLEVSVLELTLSGDSLLLGKTLPQLDFRRRFRVNVLAIVRDGVARRTNLQHLVLQEEDILVVQGSIPALEALIGALPHDPVRTVTAAEMGEAFHIQERLVALRIPKGSTMTGTSLEESRLGRAFGMTVLGITREGQTMLMPEPDEVLQEGDVLLVEARPQDLIALEALQRLKTDEQLSPHLSDLESEQVGLAEVVLSPHSNLVDKTPRELRFRERYGISILAILRSDRAYRSRIADMALRFGDALLLHGPRQRLRMLSAEEDFIVVAGGAKEVFDYKKAPLALAIMAIVLTPVFLGWLPIYISALMGAILMVLTGCISMEETYRTIEWRAIFLIAGMLPLGVALEQTGAAALAAETVVDITNQFGPMGILAGLFLLTALSAQVMPTHAVAVLMTPIALNVAQAQGISATSLMMTVAVATSASFLSPVAHPSNLLVMGPGGYRFSDYTKIGLPLTLVIMVVTLLVLPLVWPL